MVADAEAKPWRYVGSAVDGVHFEIVPGVNVWDQRWRPVRRAVPAPLTGNAFRDMGRFDERVTVLDPSYGQPRELQVWELDGTSGPLRFAAGEVSNTIFVFYLPE